MGGGQETLRGGAGRPALAMVVGDPGAGALTGGDVAAGPKLVEGGDYGCTAHA